MSDDVKRIDIKEFRAEGFLQEANRRFFHPLGLALEVVVEEDGSEHLGGVWDYRHDYEGVVFGSGEIEQEKIDKVQAEWDLHGPKREELFHAQRVVQRPEDEGL